MATHYITKRRTSNERAKPRASRTAFKQHVAWGIVCVLLLGAMTGLWTYTQSLRNQNADLRSQLAEYKNPVTTCKVTGNWTAETTKQFTIDTADGPRDYLVHLPKGFSDHKYYPLVMFYPGKGGGAQGSGITYGIYNLPAITVFPFPTIGTDGATAWQSAPYSSGADDVAFTSAILDKMQTDLCIDRTHTYAVGFSNGGAFASLLSCKLPGHFAAYAVVAGAMYAPDGDCKPPRSSPLINIHGDNDAIVPYEGSLERHLPQIESWLTMRAKIEQCAKPEVTYPDATTVVTTWNKCRGNGVVQNIRIVGGDHAWGQIPNPTLWQFLSRFSL